jgi:hypothetical protein
MKWVEKELVVGTMGHSESEILDMYITLHDGTAQLAINQISFASPAPGKESSEDAA